MDHPADVWIDIQTQQRGISKKQAARAAGADNLLVTIW
jgi:hypothetical protein